MTHKEKLRMMVVDDSPETREYLRKLLSFEANIEVVGMAANGREAVDLALEEKPDLMLMDINMPVMDGIAAAEIIFRQMPAVRVVMMSVQSEMAYLRRAMQAGAREFLIKPFTYEELMGILGEVGSLAPTPVEAKPSRPEPRVAAAPAQPVEQGTLVAVFSPRGGAGCSTVALNLAVALQGEREATVMIIDGNLRFGALDAMLNLQVSRSIADLVPSLADGEPEMLDSATLPHATGIRLLAAPPSPEMADLVTVEHTEQIIALGQQRFDYVVADLGSHLDDMTLKFMDAASCIFVLLTPEIPAVKNVRLFIDVAMSLGYESEKVLLVLNRAIPGAGINAEAIQRHLKLPIVASIPDSPRVVQAAINRGVPLILYEREVNRGMPVTRQLLTLTNMVPRPGVAVAEEGAVLREIRVQESALPPRTIPQAPKRGILSRLFGRRK
jgi:pilus assembly protein CpaE